MENQNEEKKIYATNENMSTEQNTNSNQQEGR